MVGIEAGLKWGGCRELRFLLSSKDVRRIAKQSRDGRCTVTSSYDRWCL